MLAFSDRFGARVQELLKETGLNPDAVWRLSQGEISHATVRRMGAGQVPGAELIVEFVDALGLAAQRPLEWRAQVANELLELAQKRVRYHAGEAAGSVRSRRAADPRPAAARLKLVA